MASIDFTKWSNNSTCQRIMESDYQKYIIQFEPDEVDLLNTLLSNLDFYDNEKCDIFFQKYIDFLCKIAELYPDAVFFLPCKDNKPHNSKILSSRLKKISKIYGDCVYDNYLIKKSGDYLFNKVSNIIIIEDFSGSGTSIIKMLNSINTKLIENKNVIICPMLITDYAKNNIFKDTVKWDKINLNFYLPNGERKAKLISSHSILNSTQLKLYQQICDDNHIEFKYGYKHTEELIAFSYFTPNNTLGLLWEQTEFILPFLKRDDNYFVIASNEFYFSKKNITLLKSMIRCDFNTRNRKKSLLSIYLLLGFTKKRILSCMKIDNSEYNSLIQRAIDSKIIRFIADKYVKGENFDRYIDDEVFTRLTCLNQNETNKQQIDNNFANATS